MRRSALIILAGSFLAAAAQAAPSLTVGSQTGAAGSAVNLPITFAPGGSSAVGVSFWLTLPTGFSAGTPIAGSNLTGGTVNKVALGHGTVGVSTYMVVGMFDPPPASGACSASVHCGNVNVIPTGKIMDVPITIAAGTGINTYPIQISNVVYVDAGGLAIAGGASSAGSIGVSQFSPCDVNHSGGVADIGDAVFEVGGLLNPQTSCALPGMDLNQSTGCDVGDAIRIVNVLLGGNCVTGP